MRIVCPSCQAAYEVPDKLLSGSPRKVRCARCGTNWAPEPVPAPAAFAPPHEPDEESARDPQPALQPAAPEPDLPPPPQVVLAPAPALPAPRAVEKLAPAPDTAPAPGDRRLALIAGALWLASLATIAAAAWAAFAYRDDIMAAWAPSRRFFALLGLG